MKGQSGGRKITSSNGGNGDDVRGNVGGGSGGDSNCDRKMNWRPPNQEAYV